MKVLHALLAGFAVYAAGSATGVYAQAYPTKPVRMIVPTGSGGGLDLVGRMIAKSLSEQWGQNVYVENKVGAGGTIGVDNLAKSEPDGYTLGVVATSFVINASAYSKLPYDSLRDFAPVTTVSVSPLVLVANPTLPVNSVNDLVALAKSKPGVINYASTGTGGGVHISIEMLRSLAGMDVAHIPFKGTVAAVTEVMSGRVQYTVTGLPVAKPMVEAGRLKLIAVAGTKRSPAIPNVPAISESVPGYAFNNWIGILAPANTPSDVLAKIHEGVVRAVNSPEVRQSMQLQGDEPMTMSSAEFGSLLRREISTYGTLVKSIGARID